MMQNATTHRAAAIDSETARPVRIEDYPIVPALEDWQDRDAYALDVVTVNADILDAEVINASTCRCTVLA